MKGPGLQAITKVKAMPSGAPPTEERLMQVIYNIFEQEPAAELLPVALEHKVGIIVRVAFDEGSGLSRNNLTTANATVALLQFMAKHRDAQDFLDALPVAGVDGTLATRFKSSPMKGRLWAKTGTLNEVNALSGYLTAASGKTLAFSILVNGHRPGSEAEAQAIDRIVEAIAAAE